jgi:hypothetical protein
LDYIFGEVRFHEISCGFGEDLTIVALLQCCCCLMVAVHSAVVEALGLVSWWG